MKNIKAFTLVELIVVVTILAILSTIGFVSYSGYLAGVRDTNRIAQLKAIGDALHLYSTNKSLPTPDDKIDIKVGTGVNEKIISYQGYVGKDVIETVGYTAEGFDPKDKTYFSYYLTKDKKFFQLMGYLEEEQGLASKLKLKNKVQAEIDYETRYPRVEGTKLGILTGTGTDLNKPLQELVTGELNIEYTTNEYIANIDKGVIFSGTGSKLIGLKGNIVAGGISSSCSKLLEKKSSLKGKNGIYIINPEWNDPILVFCDMEVNGGGWILVLNYLHKGGTNPNLNISNITMPLMNSSTLGDDESGTQYWGHITFELMNKLNFDEVRFYGKTSNHNRIIHFKTNTCNEYYKTGIGICNGITTNHELLSLHTGNLPVSSTHFATNDPIMTTHNFYTGGVYHWNIKVSGQRWEVDDYSVNDTQDTFHQVWVR